MGSLLATAFLALHVSACAALSDGSSSNNAPPSDIQYPVNPASYVVGAAITANKPVTSRSVTQFSITPTLPTGLSFNTATGAITGTPTAITGVAAYTVRVSNSYGSSFVSLTLAVTDHAPTISYGGTTTLTYTVGSAVSLITPTLGGGATVACESIPALPAGLSLSSSCVLSGTPTLAASTPTDYMITAINSGGSAALDLNLTVDDIGPAFTYTSGTFSLTRGLAMTGGTPTSTGGVITSCSSNITLPTGLTLGNDCTISGTPTVLAAPASYTITATNSGGNAGRTITLGVTDVLPVISYSGSPFSFTLNKSFTPIAPTNTGGYIASCSISPALPTGLSLDSSCKLSGPGTVLAGALSSFPYYTVTATNSAGSATATINVSVNDVAPTLLFTGLPYTFTHGTAIPQQNATNTGGPIVACSSSPALPAGLSVAPTVVGSTTTCSLTGTPTVSAAGTNYTITATNSGGSAMQTIRITVNAIAPNLTYAGSPYSWDKGVSITTQTPANSGDAPTNCTSNPTLPAGISLSPTCVLSGTPSVISATATYTISSTNAIGTGTTPIVVTVNDSPPVISYAGTPFTFTKNSAITPANPISTGGAIVGPPACASSPPLPTGLALSSTCVISGTPTAITSSANYTITAANAGGTGSAVVTITVNDIAPAITYAGSPFTYVRGTPITALNDNNTGGAIVSCSATPTLPAGLTVALVAGTCQISGTPTTVSASTSYTISATNTGGTSSVAISIAVVDTLPAISYAGSPFTFSKNTAIATQTPTNGGGPPTSCSSTPSLPAGLTISNLCVITGTPTVATTATLFGITATNSAGSASTTINITVLDVVPAITYTGSPFSYVKGTAITTLTPTNTGGVTTSCGSAPTLPAGLSLSSTCVITGTPTAMTAAGNYVITATNSGGNASPTATINIAVTAAPTLSYAGSPFTYVHGTAITTLTPTTGGSPITGCTSSPTLPAGLSLANTTCVITGTPSAAGVSPATDYTITATNSSGSGAATINITVNDVAPVFSYTLSPFTYTSGTAITAASPTFTAGAPTGCSSNPGLPTGLALSNACVITGTPAAGSATTSYTITATNTGGSGSATVSITVNSSAPVISYTGSPFTYLRNSAISTLTPNSTGGAIVSCASVPTLPTGLSLSATCVVTGTPSAITATANYTITATNIHGTSSASISITVNDAIPALTYAGSPFSFTVGTSIGTVTPTDSSGSTITACSSSPALPAGLSINNTTCALTGTPTAVTATGTFTITATSSGGSSSVDITVTVKDKTPTISYTAPGAYTVGTAIATLTPSYGTGGTVTGCSVSPALPGGLSLSSTCILTGTPTAVAATASYTVTATNTGGSGTASLVLTVNDKLPTISYTAPLPYSVGTPITTLTPSYGTGGTVTSCATAPALPAGLSLSSTCVITGTPTTPAGAANYTITATNSGGSGVGAVVNLTVNNVKPAISYTGSPYTFVNGTAITTQTPTNTGGATTSCASVPVLPAGLSLSTTCVISGTPTVVTVATSYTISATNAIGTGTASINITINDTAPAISFSPSSVAEVVRTAISTITPVNTGGAITGCSSSPTLPAGLSVSAACVITGTPTAISASTAYTLTATSTGGTSGAVINIQVKNQPQIAFYGLTKLTAGSWNGTAVASNNLWTATQDGVTLSILTSNTNTTLDSINPTWSGTGGNILSNSKRAQNGSTNGATSNNYNVWATTSTGASPVALTKNTTGVTLFSDDTPVVSPDGTKVVFASKQAINGTANGAASLSYNIFVAPIDGSSNPVALTQNTNTALDSKSPNWSPDGTMIYYQSKMNLNGTFNAATNANINIWRINATGTGMIALTTDNTANLDSTNPMISPSGLLVTYSSKEKIGVTTPLSFNIWSMNYDGTSKTSLTSNTVTALDSEFPKFSPDGTEITFQSKMKVAGVATTSFNIWKMAVTGASQVALTTNTAGSLDSQMPNFSPDNTMIAFYSKQKIGATTPLSNNIWVMKSDGTSPLAITQNTNTGLDCLLGTFNVWFAP